MKKILAVLIAISMVATMAFAADLNTSVEVKTEGNVVEWNKGDDFATLISRKDNAFDLTIKAATSDDKAGVEIKMENSTVPGMDAVQFAKDTAREAELDAKNTAGTITAEETAEWIALAAKLQDMSQYATSKDYVVASSGSIWIKPVDGVKVIFGAQTYSLGPDLNWDGAGDYGTVKANGFGVEYTGIENLTVAAAIDQGIKTDADKLPGMAAKVTYKVADFLNLAATVNQKGNFGVAANGKVAPVNYMVACEKFDVLKGYEKVDASIALDPVTLALAEEVKLETNKDNEITTLPFYVSAKVSYDICSVEVKPEGDLKADDVYTKTTITPEVKKTGDFGAAAYEIGAKAVITVPAKGDATVKVTVPYKVTVKF